MSTDIAPEQLVLCVDDAFTGKEQALIPVRPVKGGIYTVRDCFYDGGRGPGVWLAEIVNPPIRVRWRATGAITTLEPMFRIARFHLLDDSKLAVFREMLLTREKELQA